MYYGSAWYPEQRDESTWSGDLVRMRELGMNVVRMGEFAWSRIQPSEDTWDFEWLDRAVALAAGHGLAVVLGTPTASPPEWLTRDYSEVLRTDAEGRTQPHGSRYHYACCSARYRRFCEAVAEAMASRYGASKEVIGWQIDNEYTLMDYGPETRASFQAWLQLRYGTIKGLNDAWALDFWSQRYRDFAGVSLPDEAAHPSLRLAFKRFISEAFAAYQRVQLQAIRRHAREEQWITHNFMEWFPLYDHYTVSRELDLVSYDRYVGTGHLDLAHAGSGYDLIYGLKDRPFWLMETQPGNVNWAGVNNTLDPGETRLLAWQAVAHGAGAVLFWQWRAGYGGQEQYHGSILHAGGQPRPIYGEVQQLGEEFERMRPHLENARVKAPVVLAHCYDSQWCLDFQRHHRELDPWQFFRDVYGGFFRQGVNCAIREVADCVREARVVVLPSLFLLADETAELLQTFVLAGGIVLVGPRSGSRTPENLWSDRLPPGALEEITGIQVEERYVLEDAVPLLPAGGGATEAGKASLWGERLEVVDETVETLVTFGAGSEWLQGRPALTRKRCGRGAVYYLACRADEAFLADCAERILIDARVELPFARLPASVSVRSLETDSGPLWFFLNSGREAVRVPLPFAGEELLTGAPVKEVLELAARGVALVKGL